MHDIAIIIKLLKFNFHFQVLGFLLAYCTFASSFNNLESTLVLNHLLLLLLQVQNQLKKIYKGNSISSKLINLKFSNLLNKNFYLFNGVYYVVPQQWKLRSTERRWRRLRLVGSMRFGFLQDTQGDVMDIQQGIVTALVIIGEL